MTRRRRILVILAGVPLLAVLALGWLLGTHAGLRFVLARAEQATGGALEVRQAQGRLAGKVTLEGLRYHTADGVDVHAARVELELGPWALLRARVHVVNLGVHTLDIGLPQRAPAASGASAPFDPRAPVHLVFDRVAVDGLRVHRAQQDLFAAERVDLAGAWTRDGVELRTLRVNAADGSLDLNARMAFRTGYPGSAGGRFDWRAGGRRWSGRLQARSNGRNATATLNLTRPSPTHADLTLATRAPHAWTVKVSLPRGAASAWLGSGAGIRQLAVALDAHGDAHQLHARGSIDVDATHVQLAALDAHLGTGGKQVLLDRLQLRSPQHAGTLDVSGRIDLAQQAPSAKLHLAWKGVAIPDVLADRTLASEGKLDIDGTLERYRASVDARAGPPGQQSRIQAQVVGTPGRLQVDQLALQQAKGRLDIHGRLRYAPHLQWQLAATAKGFDPSLLMPGWSGSVNTRLSTHGALGNTDNAQLGLEALSGTLRGSRLDGHGTLALSPQRVLSGRLDLRYGSGKVALTGAKGARNDLDIRLDIGALGDWIDHARGAVTAKLRLLGSWPGLALRGSLDGSGLAWRNQRAGKLSARFDLPDVRRPGGNLHLTATDLEAGGLAFAKLRLDAQGTARAHSLDMDASGEPLSLRLALRGGMQGSAWDGRLTRLDLKLAGQPDWRLEAPVALAWNRGTASMDRACLTAGTPQLCLQARRTRDGALQASYHMRRMPLELPLALAGNGLPMRARGTLDGDGDIRRSAAGALTGQARIESSEGALSYFDHPQEPLLDYRHLDARLDLAPTMQQLRVTATLQHSGSLDGTLKVQGPHRTLDGHLRVQLDNLRFVELFTTAVANLKGRMHADLALAGTLGKPSLAGSAALDGLSGELPALGLKLDQGQLRVNGDPASALLVEGRVHSGKGTLEVAGTAGLGAGQTTRLTLRGRQVQVANLPSATVSLSPQVRVQGNAKGLRIDGTLDVDRADVNLEKLPGAGATQASPDVVVVDAGQPAPARRAALPLDADVAVDLGEHTHVTGYGLDGNLHGSLRVTTKPGKLALGQGQIRIDGTFHAYGQDLRITRGRLLFASSPLDNPGLDIRAVRKLNPNATVDEGQEVGLEIRGTARRPQLTVFSNPVMEQSDALSYLITGKPLSQVGSGEGSMINSAAQALGSATGDLLAKSVGSRLGISDIGVSSNEALGTTAFTVGKYLSPRLYLSYGVGLFEPGQVVTLRYILSRRWNFEAQQSTESSRASFNYRYEH